MESEETVSLEAASEQHKGSTQHLRQGWACGGDWGLQQCALTLQEAWVLCLFLRETAVSCMQGCRNQPGAALWQHKEPQATHCLCIVSQGREVLQQPGRR